MGYEYVIYQPSFDHRKPAPPQAQCRIESARFSRPLRLEREEDRLALAHAVEHVGKPCPLHREEHTIPSIVFAEPAEFEKALPGSEAQDLLRKAKEQGDACP